MAKRTKKAAGKVRKIDNPLLQSTLTREMPSREVKSKVAAIRREAERPAKHLMSPDEEKISVFELISDLEKQLDAAFSIKETQEEEIASLKDKLQKAEAKAAGLDAKVKDLKSAIVSQEELSSQLEFLENEQLEASEKTRALLEEGKQKDVLIKEIEKNLETLTKDIEARDTRVEQVELELNSTNKTVQSFQNQITLLEEEKEELQGKLEHAEEEVSNAVMERDKTAKELEKARESLDEIRVMLADTRAKAREHYYKRKKALSKKQ